MFNLSLSKIYHLSALVLMLVEAVTYCAAAPASPQTVRFRLVKDYLVIVTVQINDYRSYDFIVDTGSSGSLIDVELARELQLRPVDYLQLVTLTGQNEVPRTYLEAIRIGPKMMENFEVLIRPLPELRNLDSRIRGVLGQNFLSRYDYLMDYHCKCLIFDDGSLQSRMAGKPVDFIDDEGKMLISVQTPAQRPETFRLILDSGVSLPVLLHDSKVTHFFEDKDWEVRDLVGGTVAKEITLAKLTIGDRELSHQRCVVLTNQDSSRPDDGLLPLHLFDAVYFDNRRRKVIFDPRWIKPKTASDQIVDRSSTH